MGRCCDVESLSWKGVVWIGFPAPLRFKYWLSALWKGRNESFAEYSLRYPGCGCIRVLKGLTMKEKYKPWLAIVSSLMIVFIAACAAKRMSTSTEAASVAPRLLDEAENVEEHAEEIKTEAESIRDKSPDATVVASSTKILDHSIRILVSVEELKSIHAMQKKSEAECQALLQEVADLKEDLREAESSHNAKIKTWLAVVAGLAFIGVVLSVLLLKSFKLAATSACVFGFAISGMWILKFAFWIAVGTIIVLGGMAFWTFVVQGRGLRETVQTVEKLKPELTAEQVEKLKETARSTQSWFTRNTVDKLRGVPKPKPQS